MTTQSAGKQTPEHVAELATQQTHLDRTALIGIFGSEDSPGALVRSPNGRIARVAIGDEAAGGIVAAIGESQIVIAQCGKTRVLKLP